MDLLAPQHFFGWSRFLVGLPCYECFNGQTSRAPFRKTLLESHGRESALAQQSHRLEGQYAIGSAAVGDDFAILG
jgi:hypothetical protein